MKRYLAAGGAAALVFGAVLGSASALNINDGGVVQFGQTTGVSCDSNGVRVDGYNLETNTPRYPQSYGAVVSGISRACFGKTVVVRVLNRGGDPIKRGYGHTTIDGHSMKVNYENGAHVPAEDIGGVQITIG